MKRKKRISLSFFFWINFSSNIFHHFELYASPWIWGERRAISITCYPSTALIAPSSISYSDFEMRFTQSSFPLSFSWWNIFCWNFLATLYHHLPPFFSVKLIISSLSVDAIYSQAMIYILFKNIFNACTHIVEWSISIPF